MNNRSGKVVIGVDVAATMRSDKITLEIEISHLWYNTSPILETSTTKTTAITDNTKAEMQFVLPIPNHAITPLTKKHLYLNWRGYIVTPDPNLKSIIKPLVPRTKTTQTLITAPSPH